MKCKVLLSIALILILGACETTPISREGVESGGKCGDIGWVRQNIIPEKTTGKALFEMCGNPNAMKENSDGSIEAVYFVIKGPNKVAETAINLAKGMGVSMINVVSGAGMAAYEIAKATDGIGYKEEGVSFRIRNAKIKSYSVYRPK